MGFFLLLFFVCNLQVILKAFFSIFLYSRITINQFKNEKTINITFLSTLTVSFSQEITGKTTTGDKYSKAITAFMNEYLQNKFDTFKEIHADNAVFDLNGMKADKSSVLQGWSAHHQIYSNINIDWMFVETTVYDENNNNMVWSHVWGNWSSKGNKTGKDWSNPFNASFKWVDGKVVMANWIYDPTSTLKKPQQQNGKFAI